MMGSDVCTPKPLGCHTIHCEVAWMGLNYKVV